jgi:hypothetical protein
MEKQKRENPGSAIGEAVGQEMEKALNSLLKEVTQNSNYTFLEHGLEGKTLYLYDQFGNKYKIDSVIVDIENRPIIVIESKYIRYTKHNRDKGSWICATHQAVRQYYTSIRSSIAVLAGNWSKASIQMIESYGTQVFLIPFSLVSQLMSEHEIDFNWKEKDRNKAIKALEKYESLSTEDRYQIGVHMVDCIKDDLTTAIFYIINDKTNRIITKISLNLYSNLGEVKTHSFKDSSQTIEFLQSTDYTEEFTSKYQKNLLDKPVIDESRNRPN